MSALYDLFENPPSPDGEKQPLHARIVSKGTVDKEEFLDRVHKFTGISRSLLACLLYTSPSPRDRSVSRMPSSA